MFLLSKGFVSGTIKFSGSSFKKKPLKMHLWIVISGIPTLLACFFRRQVVATVVVHCAIKLRRRTRQMFEWMEKNADPVFFRLSLKLFALNRKRKTCGKTIWQVFFALALAERFEISRFCTAACSAHRMFFFAENGACTTIFPQIFFEKKNLHGQADVFVFLSSLFSSAALSENGSESGGPGGGGEAMHINVQ